MNAEERAELARLLPPPVAAELPADRHRQVKEFVMTQIQQEIRPRRRLLRPAIVAPALAAAAAVAVAAPLALGGGTAYAIAKRPDGTIQITIKQAKDPKKLQADLRRMGLNAIVDYIPYGKKCSPQPRSRGFLSAEKAPLVVWPPTNPDPGFTIDPRVVRPGQTAVLEFSVSSRPHLQVAGIWARVSTGPVAPCTLVDSTEAPLGPPRAN